MEVKMRLSTISVALHLTASCALALVFSCHALAQKDEGQCPNTEEYSDCDVIGGSGFALIGGLEQSYLSSEQDQTNAFVRANLDLVLPSNHSWTEHNWAIIRDLGAPQANGNQNIVSAIENPDGTITSSSLSTIGYSLDFLIGMGFDFPVTSNNQYSIGPIFGVGATTPQSSSSATVGYSIPALGTEECAQLQARFASGAAYKQGYSSDLIAGTGGAAGSPNSNCLYNIAGVGTAGETAVTTLAFAGINRSNFLEKWEIGARTTYRTHTTSNQPKCDNDKSTNACQRGTVDLTVGQDASLTRGLVRHFVFKIEGTQPIPGTNGFTFIYATAALRFERNASLPPLVLLPASSSALQTIPSPSVFVEPFMQPDKDFYRIGVGISLDRIFSATKKD
jgi:hypothetical protein